MAVVFGSFQHTAARRRLLGSEGQNIFRLLVSTHSRPKAAAKRKRVFAFCNKSFNTQPPEGGCQEQHHTHRQTLRFQHTAARRRLPQKLLTIAVLMVFQHTAARRRLLMHLNEYWQYLQFQHTAARRRLLPT